MYTISYLLCWISQIIFKIATAIVEKVMLDGFFSDFNFFGYDSAGMSAFNLFAQISLFQKIINGIAVTIFTLGLFKQIAMLIAEPVHQRPVSHPIKLIGKAVLIIALLFSYKYILGWLFNKFSTTIPQFTEIIIKQTSETPDITNINNNITLGNGDTRGHLQRFTEDIFTGFKNNILVNTFLAGAGGACLLACVNYITDYFVLGMYCMLSPIAIAFGIDDESEDIPPQYFKNIGLQLVNIVLTLFYFGMAFYSLGFNYTSSGIPDENKTIYSLVLYTVFMGMASQSERILVIFGLRANPPIEATKDLGRMLASAPNQTIGMAKSILKSGAVRNAPKAVTAAANWTADHADTIGKPFGLVGDKIEGAADKAANSKVAQGIKNSQVGKAAKSAFSKVDDLVDKAMGNQKTNGSQPIIMAAKMGPKEMLSQYANNNAARAVETKMLAASAQTALNTPESQRTAHQTEAIGRAQEYLLKNNQGFASAYQSAAGDDAAKQKLTSDYLGSINSDYPLTSREVGEAFLSARGRTSATEQVQFSNDPPEFGSIGDKTGIFLQTNDGGGVFIPEKDSTGSITLDRENMNFISTDGGTRDLSSAVVADYTKKQEAIEDFTVLELKPSTHAINDEFDGQKIHRNS